MSTEAESGAAEERSIHELEQRGHKLLAEAVGAAAVAGSYLEDALASLLSELIGNPDVDAITAGLSADQMIQSCKVILRDNPDLPGADRTGTALDQAKVVYIERSSVVHAIWANVFKAEDGLMAIRVRRWQKGFKPRVWKLAELHDVAERVRAATRELSACLYGYRTGDFTRQATENPSYAAFEEAGGGIIVMNTLGVDDGHASRHGFGQS